MNGWWESWFVIKQQQRPHTVADIQWCASVPVLDQNIKREALKDHQRVQIQCDDTVELMDCIEVWNFKQRGECGQETTSKNN